MKRLFFLFALIVLLASATQSQTSGSFGIQTSIGSNGDMIAGKYWLSKSLAGTGGLNFESPSGGITSYAAQFGLEAHFTPMNSVSPYLGGSLSFGNPEHFLGIGAHVGGEYFFSPSFSLAGQVGIRYLEQSNFGVGDAGGHASTSWSSTSMAAILTWYIQ